MKKYIKYLSIFCICILFICQYRTNSPSSISKVEREKDTTLIQNVVDERPTPTDVEITFADIAMDVLDSAERIDYFVRQDSLYHAGNSGIYGNSTFYVENDNDTLPIKNGTKRELLPGLKDSTLLYPNSGFVIRPFDTKYGNSSWSLWTFTHFSVRNK